jgi:hypothetical protein
LSYVTEAELVEIVPEPSGLGSCRDVSRSTGRADPITVTFRQHRRCANASSHIRTTPEMSACVIWCGRRWKSMVTLRSVTALIYAKAWTQPAESEAGFMLGF